jgi:hypothetical protein
MNARVEPSDGIVEIDVEQRRRFLMNTENHQVDKCVNAHQSALHIFHIALKLIRKKETSPSDYPVVRIADKQNSSAMRGFDCRSVGEEQMPPTEHISRRIKRPAMLCEIGPLNKLSMILLLKRNECADDVS